VAEVLRARSIAFAAVGAGAMAARGVARGTRDLDLLALAPECLQPTTWIALPPSITVRIQRGDGQDPLAGVARFTSEGGRPVDLIVGKSPWQRGVLDRADTLQIEGVPVPVASLPDLILLKLYAGGPQDAWDVAQLLEIDSDRGAVEAQVEEGLGAMPEECRRLWLRISRR
jgi:hypothetical protein